MVVTSRQISNRPLQTRKGKSTKMKRALVGVLALGLFLLATGSAAADSLSSFNFTSGLAPWNGASLPVPVPGGSGLSTSTVSILSLGVEGNGATDNKFAALRASTNGLFFMTSTFPDADNTVRISFQAKDLQDCKHCQVAVYVGSGKPTNVSQFKVLSTSLTSDWQTYTYEVPIKADNIVVAAGIANLSSIVTRAGIDNLTIQTFNR